MKETVKINLAQRLYDLDEDAYRKLKKYLDSLNQYFSKEENGSEEILLDIEQRIAEILDGRLNNDKKVVTMSDVYEIIEMMGTIEDFKNDDSYSSDETNKEQKESSEDDFSKENRQLFRDNENNILGGVCAGLAAYFNTDAIWIRIAFIILFFINLIGLVIYLILWVIVPPAITRTQKLKMQGRAVNIENIEESVKSEFDKVKDGLQRFSETEGFKRTRDTAGEAIKGLGNVLVVILKILGIIIGIGLALAGLAVIFGLITFFTMGNFWSNWQIPESAFTDQILPAFNNLTLFSAAVFIAIVIPVVAIISGIVRLIFNLGKTNRVLSAFTWTFWSLAIVFVIVTLIIGNDNKAFSHDYKDTIEINIPINKILHIRLNEEDISGSRIEYYTIFGKEIVSDQWDDSFLLKPEIEILPSENLSSSMLVEYSSFVPFDHHEMEDISYHYSLNDSILVLDNYWRVDDEDIWRLPKVKIHIFLPESQQVHLDPDFKRNKDRLADGMNWPDSYYGGTLIMKEDGLIKK
jgi:phage shock protein PspC (stress-responsive transcriptional regulator)